MSRTGVLTVALAALLAATPATAQQSETTAGSTCGAIAVPIQGGTSEPMRGDTVFDGQAWVKTFFHSNAQVWTICVVVTGVDVRHTWSGSADCGTVFRNVEGSPVILDGFQHQERCPGELHVCTQVAVKRVSAPDEYTLYYDPVMDRWADDPAEVRCEKARGTRNAGFVVLSRPVRDDLTRP